MYIVCISANPPSFVLIFFWDTKCEDPPGINIAYRLFSLYTKPDYMYVVRPAYMTL